MNCIQFLIWLQHTPKDTEDMIVIHDDSNDFRCYLKPSARQSPESEIYFKRWEKRFIYLLNTFCKFYLRKNKIEAQKQQRKRRTKL